MRVGSLPRLHLVTDDRIVARDDFVPLARTLRARGGSRLAFHLRGPETRGRRLYDRARAILEGGEAAGGPFLANDRVDLALVLALDGVHLGGRSLGVSVARELLEPGRWIGASVHGVAEAIRAAGDGADYLVVGTIYRSPSHPGREPAGPERIARIARSVGCPLVAIGGITPDRVAPVLAAGAHGVAVRGGIWEDERPLEALDRYLEVLGGRPETP